MHILLKTGITIGAILAVLISCQHEVDIKTAQYAVNGQKVYRTHCQNCHGEKGEGLGNLYPPLTDTTFLQTHRQLEVAGKKFNNTMPASNLSAIDIAYVLTYINTKINKGKNLYPLEDVEKSLKGCK